MAEDMESLEARLEKRREVDMIVKMRVDQLQRENVFASPAALENIKRVAEEAQKQIDALSKRVAELEAKIASPDRGPNGRA
jgi:wobble nucleotide-excising tRNase